MAAQTKKLPAELEAQFRTANPRVKKFRAKAAHLQLTIKGDQDKVDTQGNLHIVKGKRIIFTPAPEGGGHYETEDKSEVEFLRGHRGFNNPGAKMGFTELTGESVPAPDDLLSAITDLAISAELPTLKLIYERESASFKRGSVLATCGQAIGKLEELKAEKRRTIMAENRAKGKASEGSQAEWDGEEGSKPDPEPTAPQDEPQEGAETPAQDDDLAADGEPEKEVAVLASGDDA